MLVVQNFDRFLALCLLAQAKRTKVKSLRLVSAVSPYDSKLL